MWSQSLWNRAVSYDTILAAVGGLFVGSQSLWNRAVSYDKRSITASQIPQCLNPFGTGQCLTTEEKQTVKYRLNFVSIPLEQGSVLRHGYQRPLSRKLDVSIPLEQGSVLRRVDRITSTASQLSQSLWNRAVSYDDDSMMTTKQLRVSQSLWNRAVSYDLNKQHQ